MSHVMVGRFSVTQSGSATAIFQSGANFQRGGVHPRRVEGEGFPMPVLPESPEEIEARRLLQLAEQRTMLEHLPAWLRMRSLRQRDVAHALGVSDATVSNWIAGKQQMSVGQLRQIAVLLKAQPGDLLREPANAGLSEKVEETLGLMDALSESEWDAVLQTARAIAQAKQKN